MKSLPLNAHPRTQARRKGARILRAAGRIPAVIYGRHHPPQNLEVDAKAFDDLVHLAHTEIILVDLQVPQDPIPSRLALVQDVQHHALTGKTLHIDFHEVKADELVTIDVPVESKGEAEGVKSGGGTLEHVRFRVKVRALPKDLPDQIVVDVTHLKVGETIHIGELTAPEGVEILGDKKIPILAVAAPLTAEAETAAAPAADGKQPEMIKEKKEDTAAADKKAGDKKAADAKPADKKK
jgi:large subunit ribosomal protein L25